MADAAKLGEIKAPAGSVAVDASGRLWTADVAGHVACYTSRGVKQFDAAGSPSAAAAGTQLPADVPLPAMLRADAQDAVWALFTAGRKLVLWTAAARHKASPSRLPPPAVSGGWRSRPADRC